MNRRQSPRQSEAILLELCSSHVANSSLPERTVADRSEPGNAGIEKRFAVAALCSLLGALKGSVPPSEEFTLGRRPPRRQDSSMDIARKFFGPML